ERLQAQLGDLKGKSKDTSCVSDTLNPLSQKLENKNVELEFQDTTRGTSANTKFAKQSILRKPPKVGETHALSKPVTSNSIPTPQESKVGKNDKVIAPGMFRINHFKPSREEKHVPNKVRASVWTKPVTVSQSPVFTKKVLNSDSNGLSSTRVIQICLWCVDSGCSKHMTGNLNHLINFVWKFLGTVRFGNDHVAAILGFSDLQWGNILITRVYFVEGFGHNLFSVGEFCDSDLEAALRKNTCFVRNLEGVDLLKENLYNRRTKKIMETMNVSFNELSAMAFEQCSSKPGLQRMTSGQISSGLDLTYALSTITQQPTKGELNLQFEAMYDDYIGGQPSSAPRIVPAAQAHQIRQTTTTSTSIADTAPTPTISSSQATNFPNPTQDVDGLISSKQHAQQQGNQAPLQPETVADNVPNAMFDANTFVNPFANSLT
nr:integrase, catalytic region, zinc finger, CCHC-type, peptidase aspartic, catalytic [Tanacetum cinerariifolium]